MSDGNWRMYDLEVDLIVSGLPHLFVDAPDQPDSPLCIKQTHVLGNEPGCHAFKMRNARVRQRN
jgi:hypothetical protein